MTNAELLPYCMGKAGAEQSVHSDWKATQILRDEFGVYLIASGRMCVAGLNAGNVQRVAQAFAAVM